MKKLLIAVIFVTGLGYFNAYAAKGEAVTVTKTTKITKIKWPKWITDLKKKIIIAKQKYILKKKFAEAKKHIKKQFTKKIDKIIENTPTMEEIKEKLKELENVKIKFKKIKFPAS